MLAHVQSSAVLALCRALPDRRQESLPVRILWRPLPPMHLLLQGRHQVPEAHRRPTARPNRFRLVGAIMCLIIGEEPTYERGG